MGSKPFEALPSYLKLIDVGLVPYAATEFNRWSFPMKALEYLAAGRPVVATSLPAMRWLETEHIALADTAEEFAASVVRSTAVAQVPEMIAGRRAFARSHSWADRAERLTRMLAQPAH